MRPLSGKRVIAWTVGVAGPYGGMVFAELGAEVILLERPGGKRPVGGILSHERNKKSIAINAREEDGKEIIRRLIKTADVFYENFAPGAVIRLGFPPEEVLKINPKIVYVSCKGYGEGPYGTRPAWDPCIESETGYMALTGYKDEEAMPMRVGAPSVDHTTAIFNVLSAIGGLLNVEKTGKGCYIRANMFEDAISSLAHHVALYSLYGKTLGPMGSGEGAAQAFETSNWWVFIDAQSDAQWKNLCTALDIDEKSQKAFAKQEARDANPEQVETIVGQAVSKMTSAEVIQKLEIADVPVGPVNTMKEVLEDPHYTATGFLVPLMHDKELIGTKYDRALTATMLPLQTTTYNPEMEGWGGVHAPQIGGTTVEILGELGYSADEITDLRKRKIVSPYMEET
jgi:CoA:oxalate CoA-transferase